MTAFGFAQARGAFRLQLVAAVLALAGGILIIAEIRAQFASRPISDAATPYSLSLSGRAPNWAAPLTATKITPVRGGLDVQGTRSAFAYQLVTWPIEVDLGVSYRVSFDADVTLGRMGVGVLDMETHHWIVQHSIVERSGAFVFTPTSPKIQVVLYNDNGIETESAAVLRKLTVTRTEK